MQHKTDNTQNKLMRLNTSGRVPVNQFDELQSRELALLSGGLSGDVWSSGNVALRPGQHTDNMGQM